MATEIKGPFERSQMINRLREESDPTDRTTEAKIGILLLTRQVVDYYGAEMNAASKARDWLYRKVSDIALIKYKPHQ